MKNNLFFSCFLVIMLLFSSVTTSFANGSSTQDNSEIISNSEIREFIDTLTEEDYNKNSSLPEMITEIEELLEKNEDIKYGEFTKIIDKYAKFTKQDTKLKKTNSIDELVINDFERIDALAEVYYQQNFDFYLEYGYFPDSTTSITARAVTVNGEALKILKKYGVNWTEKQLLARLATLGAIAALDGPMPVGDFIALLTGAILLNPNLDNYYDNLDELLGYLRQISLKDAISKVTGAVEVSIKTRKDIKRGKKHFVAWLSAGGWGGVFIGEPITLRTAQNRARGGYDTFSVSKIRARDVVDQEGYWYLPEGPHYTGGYIANLPHYHMTTDRQLLNRLDGHHFFPYDPLD